MLYNFCMFTLSITPGHVNPPGFPLNKGVIHRINTAMFNKSYLFNQFIHLTNFLFLLIYKK